MRLESGSELEPLKNHAEKLRQISLLLDDYFAAPNLSDIFERKE